MRLLDRYIISNFLIPFSLCFLGFLGIWLVFDLGGNLQDFIEGHASLKFVFLYYLTQLPQITVMTLPIGLLLALLYALSKMSRSNEIIAMLTAGESLGRLMAPLVAIGLLLTGVSTLLNFKWAPHAESLKKEMMRELSRKRDKDTSIDGQLFRNRIDNRTWYVVRMPANGDNRGELQRVMITEQDREGNIHTKWYAWKAKFEEETKTWTLYGGKITRFDSEGNVVSDTPFTRLPVTGWSENPWRIASSNFEAHSLSVAELRAYLRYNWDFPDTMLAPYRVQLQYRWALPWECFVVVFLAAPLGIVYSRRGVLSGVAGAIFCFALMMFLTSLMMALGKGSHLPSAAAAWGPFAFFLLIGFYLLYIKSTNREMPSLRQLFRF